MDDKRKHSGAQMRAKAAARKTKPKGRQTAKRTRTSATVASTSRDRVRVYRKRMRAKGLRLVQMWVPGTQEPIPAQPLRETQCIAGADAAAVRKAWAEALAPLTPGYATSFDDIADLVGSVDGLPSDLASNKDKYLRAGYGRKRHR